MAVFQTKADELEERFVDFAVAVIKLTNKLPETPAGRHVARQILRSGTSPAPNDGEARGAESDSDFVHKLSIVLKELNETSIWLRIIKKSGLTTPETAVAVLEENGHLSRIVGASLQTTRRRMQEKKSPRAPLRNSARAVTGK